MVAEDVEEGGLPGGGGSWSWALFIHGRSTCFFDVVSSARKEWCRLGDGITGLLVITSCRGGVEWRIHVRGRYFPYQGDDTNENEGSKVVEIVMPRKGFECHSVYLLRKCQLKLTGIGRKEGHQSNTTSIRNRVQAAGLR